MKVKILSWNTALTERPENKKDIINYIKDFLKKTNSVAVLQQLPFKDPKTWEVNNTYSEIQGSFSEEGYNIYCNSEYNNGCICMMTAVITKMNNVKEADKKYYPNSNFTNRESAVSIQSQDQKSKLVVLGIHAKNNFSNNGYLTSINGNADIILGDFNAGNYLESENMNTFNSILKDHVCICNMPTKEILDRNGKLKRKSCIDHIFVKRNLVSKCSLLMVHENIRHSDHYPISFEIEVFSTN